MQTFWIVLAICLALIIFFLEKKLNKKKAGLTFTLYFNHLTIKSQKMKITLRKSQLPVKGHLNPTNDAGDVEGVQSVNYNTDNAATASIVPDPDDPENSEKFQIIYGGTLGVANLGASADADLTDGVTTITDSIELTVIDDMATKLNMQIDLPATNTGSAPAPQAAAAGVTDPDHPQG